MTDMERKGRIGHDYSFNYFGGDRYDGKIIGGASVDVLFQCYGHNGNERLFTEKDDISSILDVSFDRDDAYHIDVNPFRMQETCRKYGLRDICFHVHRYCLYYVEGHLSDELKTADGEQKENIQHIMKALGDVPTQAPMQVDETVFRQFLLEHADDFDISDNMHAQTCSVFIEEAS